MMGLVGFTMTFGAGSTAVGAVETGGGGVGGAYGGGGGVVDIVLERVWR
jgi:hypothetical protein